MVIETMTRNHYLEELVKLYENAMECNNLCLAWEILETRRKVDGWEVVPEELRVVKVSNKID